MFNPTVLYAATAPPKLTKVVPCIHPTLELNTDIQHVAYLCSQHHDVTVTVHLHRDPRRREPLSHQKGNYHNHNTEAGE
jgi:hypothetical protein